MVVVRSVRIVTSIEEAASCGAAAELLHPVDHVDNVGAGLPLNVQDDGGNVVHPRSPAPTSSRWWTG